MSVRIDPKHRYTLHNVSDGDVALEATDAATKEKVLINVPSKGRIDVPGALLATVAAAVLEDLQAPKVSAYRTSPDGEKLDPPEALLIVGLAG